jgi:hypothetical protein
MIQPYHTIDAKKRLYHFRGAGRGLERFIMLYRPRSTIFHLLAFTALLSFVACAQPSAPDHRLAPERLAQLERICTDTMQLTRGTTHFEDCMDVLGTTARRIDKPKAQP